MIVVGGDGECSYWACIPSKTLLRPGEAARAANDAAASAKHAVSFVRVGEPAADASWRAPSDMALDIIPERDATALRAVVALPQAGRWLLAGTDLRRVTELGLTRRSDFSTVTLAVWPRSAGRPR